MCVFVIEVSFMLLWIFCIASLIWGAVIHHLSQNFQHLCFLSVCKPHFMCEEWNSTDNGVVTLTCIFSTQNSYRFTLLLHSAIYPT